MYITCLSLGSLVHQGHLKLQGFPAFPPPNGGGACSIFQLWAKLLQKFFVTLTVFIFCFEVAYHSLKIHLSNVYSEHFNFNVKKEIYIAPLFLSAFTQN